MSAKGSQHCAALEVLVLPENRPAALMANSDYSPARTLGKVNDDSQGMTRHLVCSALPPQSARCLTLCVPSSAEALHQLRAMSMRKLANLDVATVCRPGSRQREDNKNFGCSTVARSVTTLSSLMAWGSTRTAGTS